MTRFPLSLSLALLLLGFVLAGPAALRAGDELGPAVGTALPHPLTLPDHTGTDRNFADLTGPNGLALFFVRSVRWCPYCKTQMIEAGKAAPAFAERGVAIVGLSYDAPEAQARFLAEAGLDMTFLSDTGSVVIDAFGVRNPEPSPGSFAYGIPHPIVVLIDADGIIRDKLHVENYAAEGGYKDRPSVEAVLAAVDRMVAGGAGAD